MNTPPLSPDTVIAGRYEIRATLGAGGMARVYRARDLDTGAKVALKHLPASASAELAERFGREVRNAARLDHPSCIRILDSGRGEDGGHFFVMEHLGGGTLGDELSRGALSADRASAIARDLLGALAHAHARGLLHRDLKPDNVMFRREDGVWRAVLIDFGLSEGCGDARLTATGSCVGSPSYLAPERILGTTYDGRADLYAVGILLYEMMTGERPFSGKSPLDTARQHLEREPPSLSSACPDAPPALVRVCERALKKRPEDRHSDAAEMAEALGARAPAAAPWWRRALAWLGAGTKAPTPTPTLSLAGSGALRIS